MIEKLLRKRKEYPAGWIHTCVHQRKLGVSTEKSEQKSLSLVVEKEWI